MALPIIIGAAITGGLTWAFTGSLLAGIIMGGLTLLSGILTPKPKNIQMKPASLADFSVTQAYEGQPIPIVYGRVKIPGNIIYYGNLTTVPEYQKVKGGKGGDTKKKVITGYHYYLDIWQAICMGQINLEKMFIDDDENKSIQAQYQIFNNGTQNIYPTTADNSDLEFASALPGVAHIFWKQFYVGFNRNVIPTVYFIVKRVLNTGLSYPDIIVDNEYRGNNPASILYDLLINFGEINPAFINYTNFEEASNYFNSKGIGLNYIFSSERQLNDIIEEICGLLNIMLDYDNDGKIIIKILDNDTTSKGQIQDDFISFQLNKPSWNSIINEIKANLVVDGKIKSIILENPAGKLMANKTISKTYDLTAISSISLGYYFLTKILKEESFPRITLDITVPLKYGIYNIGDVITIINSEINLSSDFRILAINEPKIDNNEIHMSLIQCTENLFDTTYIIPPQIQYSKPSYDLVPFSKIKLIELDYNTFTGENLTYLICVSKEKGYETGYAIYISYTGADYELLQICSTFAIAGTLETNYPANTYEIDDERGFIFTPYNDFMQFENISRTNLFTDKRLIVIDNELMAFQNYIPHGTNSYKITGIIRNLLWSKTANHNINSLCFITNIGDNIIFIPQNNSQIYIKIVPLFLDKQGDIAQASAIILNPTFKAKKPLPPQRIIAIRTGSNINVLIFPISKIKNSSAGFSSADSYTDTYPFEYEGTFVVQINNDPPQEYSTCYFTITNTNSFTLKVQTKWNGYLSQQVNLNIGTADGEYIWNNPNF